MRRYTVHPNSRAGGLSAWVVRRAARDHSVGTMPRRELPPLMAAIFTGFTVPITTPQILWVNMVTSDALGLVISHRDRRHATAAARHERPILDAFSGMACHLCWSHTARTDLIRVFLGEVERHIR